MSGHDLTRVWARLFLCQAAPCSHAVFLLKTGLAVDAATRAMLVYVLPQNLSLFQFAGLLTMQLEMVSNDRE